MNAKDEIISFWIYEQLSLQRLQRNILPPYSDYCWYNRKYYKDISIQFITSMTNEFSNSYNMDILNKNRITL